MADVEVIKFQIDSLTHKQRVLLFQTLIQEYSAHWVFAAMGEKERVIWAQSFGELAKDYFRVE